MGKDSRRLAPEVRGRLVPEGCRGIHSATCGPSLVPEGVPSQGRDGAPERLALGILVDTVLRAAVFEVETGAEAEGSAHATRPLDAAAVRVEKLVVDLVRAGIAAGGSPPGPVR